MSRSCLANAIAGSGREQPSSQRDAEEAAGIDRDMQSTPRRKGESKRARPLARLAEGRTEGFEGQVCGWELEAK